MKAIQQRDYQRTYGANQSLREMKCYLGDRIKTEIWSQAENWLNQILGGKTKTIYYPKEIKRPRSNTIRATMMKG